MSLLEVITKASANPTEYVPETNYPIILNPDPGFLALKPKNDDPNAKALVKAAEGWQISPTDTEIIELNGSFFKKLKKKLKNPNGFKKYEFLEMLNNYLERVGETAGLSSVSFENAGEKLRVLLGKDVKGLVLEACVVLEDWESLERFIVNGVVEHRYSSNLIINLIEKRRSDLLVLCVKYLSDLQTYDLMCILKYFLLTPKDGFSSMASVRKEWESQALISIEKISDKSSKGKNLTLAKDASLLIMVAYDGFSVSELCLHYLLASRNLDEVILSACISKLNGSEIMSLIKYLGKWLKKYERFPQVDQCPDAASVLGLKVCNWIPTIEDIVKCLGLVVDEHFSSLVLHQELHEELISLEGIVTSLAAKARFCGTIATLAHGLRNKHTESFLEKLHSSFLL